nr:uncharacterized protein LOC112074421 isoform X3 [Salvelinus alpinus]
MDRTLLCSADLQPLTQFIWRIPEGSESPGPELFIPGVENQDSENQESVYTCVVKNPVSERTAEFTLKDCHTEEGSTSVLAVVLSILLLLVLVAVLAFLLWCWRKGKKPAEAALRKSEEEAGLMEVTVQGNKDPEDDHSDNTGNRTSTPKVTDTEPVQDKPNPAQPKLVTPDHSPAPQRPITQDHTPAQQDLVTPDPNEQHITQTTLQGQSRDSTGSIENQEEMEHERHPPRPQ